MKTNEYRTKALETEAAAAPIADRLQRQSSVRISHAILGLISDFREYALASEERSIMEELGDLLWFNNLGLTGARQIVEAHGVDIGELSYVPPRDLTGTLSLQIAEAACVFKSIMVYGRDKPKHAIHLYSVFYNIDVTLEALCRMHKMDPDKVRSANIEKLNNARYRSGKFTEEAANNRDVEGEYRAMAQTPLT